MFSFFKAIGLKRLLSTEIPSLIFSLVLIETFCKFGSFILEFFAFAGIWMISSFIITKTISPQHQEKD